MDWDNFIFEKVDKIIHQGNTVIDVGAHIGRYTEHFLGLVGITGKVISFEVNPDTFNTLDNKFKDHPNITLINVAVSDESGFEDYYSKGHHTNIIGHDVNGKGKKVIGNIKSIRLDEYINEKIDFIKIDVEGAEIKVLKGIEKAIKNIKCLLIECHYEQDWSYLKDILFKYNLKCTNLLTGEQISSEAEEKPYQLLCYNECTIQ